MEFNMKGGVLGIIVVCVILGMSILLVSVLDVQEETREVTKYNYVTDTTSLFDFDKTPQYMDYDMVLNYTGYYTRDSQPYWGGVGDKDDGYYTTTTINRYVLNLEPLASTDTVMNLSLVTWNNSDPPGQLNQVSNFSVSVYGADGVDYGISFDNGYKVENRANKPNTVTISDLLTQYALSDYTKVTLTPTSSSIADRLVFTSTEDYHLYHEEGAQKVWGHKYSMSDMADTYTTYSMYFVNYNTSVACLSCVVDITTEMVMLYSSPTIQDGSTLVRSVPLDKACIVFGGTAVHYTDAYTIPFGNSVHIVGQTLLPNEYLDISKGVRVTEEIGTQYATVSFAMNPLIDFAPYPISVPLATTISLSGNTIVFTYGSYTATEIQCPTVPGYEVDSISGGNTVTDNMTITINYTETEPSQSYTLSFVADNGTVSPTTLTVAPGTAITASDNTMTIDGTTITATADAGYTFYSWTAFGSEIPATVESNMVITANFTTSSGVSGSGTQNDPYTKVKINAYQVSTYFSGNDKYVKAGTVFNITDYDDGNIDTWVNNVTSDHGLYVDNNDWALKGTLTGSGTVTIEVMETDGSSEGTATYTFYIVEG